MSITEIGIIAENIAKSFDLKVLNIKRVNLKRPSIQVLIERLDKEGVSVQECAKMHRSLELQLKIAGQTNLALEVSSAGIDRPLFVIEDYHQFLGRIVKVKLNLAKEYEQKRIRNFTGQILKVVDENTIHFITQDEIELTILLNEIQEARLELDPNLLKQLMAKKKA